MPRIRGIATLGLLVLIALVGLPTAAGRAADGRQESAGPVAGVAGAPDGAAGPAVSHRLIVQLASPSLVEWARARPASERLFRADGRLDLDGPAAQGYLARLRAEQALFVKQIGIRLPGAALGRFIDELGRAEPLTYQVTFNGLTVDPGRSTDLDRLAAELAVVPGVRTVYRDGAHAPTMYASLPLIGARSTWDLPAIGGIASAGAGIKVASVDGGIHHAGRMFDGAGYDYPAGYPRGYAANTNGKIIVSRSYFRSWDPPAAGDEHPWPGLAGTSHGQHTASTAVGNVIETDHFGNPVSLSGVAPRAYAMSYRVFYGSVQGIGSVYSAEGIAAIEDVVRDGADVVNNSWGGGAYSQGGPGDPLDVALVGAWRAGVFVSMSAGNAGPLLHTADHPSEDYVSVANSTTTGSFVTEYFVSVTAPEPVPPEDRDLRFAVAAFGQTVRTGWRFGPSAFRTARAVDPANEEGCVAFPTDAFTGTVAVIPRGTCEFGLKALNAQQAGATLVIVHNTEANADSLTTMGAGEVGGQVTIPAVLVGYTAGTRLGAWHDAHGDEAHLALEIRVRQAGNTPDIIARGSSRGPVVGDRLKPDIAAPGTNILAEGFADAAGEDRHLGLGQASGTSMAAPHVSGAAALLRQVHPDWPPDWVKSALMSTAKYTDVFVDAARTVPAQPLDMGAGRLDLTRAADPGVVLSPPSLSFGRVPAGQRASIALTVTSVAGSDETYVLSSVDTADSFTATVPVAGLSFDPGTLSLAPGASTTVTVTWDTTAARHASGHNQGYLVLDGPVHDAHLPAWIQVAWPDPGATVLLLDNDGSSLSEAARRSCTGQEVPPTYPDYTGYYTRTLAALAVPYEVIDVDARFGTSEPLVPDANALLRHRVVLHQTGSNPCSVFPTSMQHRLREFSNHGGAYVGFGQNLSAVLGSADATNPANVTTFFGLYLASEFLQDSINAQQVFTATAQPLFGVPNSPLAGMALDVSARGDGAGNQVNIDEIRPARDAATVPGLSEQARPVLLYPGGRAKEDGYVAMCNRERPSLEYPGLAWLGKTMFFAFGLEGVNSDTGLATRDHLLDAALKWVLDDATVGVIAHQEVKSARAPLTFSAAMQSATGGPAVALRWDFGDGSPILAPVKAALPGTPARPHAGHVYARPGRYVVRVEATNALGTAAVGQTEIEVVAAEAPWEEGEPARPVVYLPATRNRVP